MTTAWANWNGQEMPLDEVMVPALDRAFLFGDAVYELIRVYRGRAWQLEDHLARLGASMARIEIGGIAIETIHSRVASTLDHGRISEGLLYIQVTRGTAKRTHFFPASSTPNVLIYIEQFDDPYKSLRANGIDAITYPDIRWARNEIKATSLLANCLAAQAAKDANCTESILFDSAGFVTEGSRTSVFGVMDGKVVVAPAAPNILPGITKKQVLNLAGQSGIETIEGRLKIDDLWACEEVFVTGTSAEILPVVRIDGRAVSGGTVGAVTRRLQQTFQTTLDSWLQKAVQT